MARQIFWTLALLGLTGCSSLPSPRYLAREAAALEHETSATDCAVFAAVLKARLPGRDLGNWIAQGRRLLPMTIDSYAVVDTGYAMADEAETWGHEWPERPGKGDLRLACDWTALDLPPVLSSPATKAYASFNKPKYAPDGRRAVVDFDWTERYLVTLSDDGWRVEASAHLRISEAVDVI
ncbi:hypothetical protein [Caulobacter sp. 17J65-9]|uniref:hypothetical protein n=1 Tax=Caulobacter sp. 17J65-9 TaxID=2709382 RepID=UPI0013C56652|nr:hypothetical protein [Caulobacter sp. 17J65-9]NEX94669.1 hypothetical protein [Caulobacter sp. 17J65-9]